MTPSSPMSVQGQPAAIVPATTQTPKAIIPAEIRNENTVSMIGPLSSRPRGSQAALPTRRRDARRAGPPEGALISGGPYRALEIVDGDAITQPTLHDIETSIRERESVPQRDDQKPVSVGNF
jgi:hypothetical protein